VPNVRRVRHGALLVLLLLGGAGAPCAVAATHPRSLSISAEGRQREILVSGVLNGAHPANTRLLLQQLAEVHGRWLWRTRSRTRVRGEHFRLRWRRPTLGAPLLIRAIALARGKLIARSAATQVTAGDPGAVFYSGKGQAGAGDVGDNSIRLVAGFTFLHPHYDGLWTGPHECETVNALPSRSSIGSEPITELAGFSLGRLGPIYFIDRWPSWIGQVSYILLFDPGPQSEMSPCDPRPDIAPAAALARWLSLHSSNRLVIMAGPETLSDNYAGLDHYYLHGLSPVGQRQVLICAAGRPDHTHFLAGPDGGYGWMVGAPTPGSCPSGSSERQHWRAPLPSGAPGPVTTPPSSGGSPNSGTVPLGPGELRVMNAAGGIYWRSAPDWGTPVAVGGNGFYEGTVVRVSCYQAGAANVPGSTDAMWEQASWAAGPGSGSGWINEHFIDDGAPLGAPSPGVPPCPSTSEPPPPPPPPATFSEQETPNHPVNTFTNYHNASGMGPAIATGQWVQVSCKVYDPTIASVNPDGYWYRVASSPWNGSYYSPANTFMNGDPYGGPYTHNTDFAVPDC
jgi:hypothetical protein